MITNRPYRQPWIKNHVYDAVFILCPPFIALLIVWLMPARFKYSDAMPVIGWCVLILFVDVAHVYSTLYNTYFDKRRFVRRKTLFIVTPIACYVVGIVLCFSGWLVFWRALAYLAVFHFIRQQYGFMRLYTRNDAQKKWFTFVDALAIYAATVYPIIYWHCTPSRNFNWFINNDFIIDEARNAKMISFYIYLAILLLYIVKELVVSIASRRINLPKNLIILGTFISWYFGIVYFNGDMAFTLLNTVSHGIPYMALVWIGLKKQTNPEKTDNVKNWSLAAKWYGLAVFLCSLFLFAYIEEGFWDGFVWREHAGVFGFFHHLSKVNDNILLALLVPLLSLPQSTHYVLDGFIWRKKYS